jgi:chemotaxis protein methyltransferase CheR
VWDHRRPAPAGLAYDALGFSSAAFGLLRDLIAERTGVHYADGKRDLLMDRVAPLVVGRGLPSLLDYYYLLKYDLDASDAWAELRDRLAVPETYFWRQPEQFESLVRILMPRFAARPGGQPVRIWSAACCSGEEPLSIAMALDQGGWFDRMPIQITGSDASAALVERARVGRYGERSLRNLPSGWRERYFTGDPSGWSIDRELHSRIRWTTANLIDPEEAGPLAEVDVIYCRNVFIYFSDDGIRRVVGLFWDRMPPGGHLFVGASESLARLGTNFVMDELGEAFVYRKEAGATGPGIRRPQRFPPENGQRP